MKKTAIAHPNIALIKYWGKRNEKLNLPYNTTIAINLSNLWTITTVDVSERYDQDEIVINEKKEKKEVKKVIYFLDLVRKLAKRKEKVKVVSRNNFPIASGLASSSSGFAALALASSVAFGLNLSEKELSILARLGSGSACRSVPSGFVEWKKGKNSKDSYAFTIFSPNYWTIKILTLVVTQKKKEVLSNDGHLLASTSPFFKKRISLIDKKINRLKKAIVMKDFLSFGKIIEQEALEMHAIALTSKTPLVYWNERTVFWIKKIFELRKQGFLVFFTIDAGPNLHLFCLEKDGKKIFHLLNKSLIDKEQVIINSPGEGVRLTENHLF